jgi:hypothetical protein
LRGIKSPRYGPVSSSFAALFFGDSAVAHSPGFSAALIAQLTGMTSAVG